MLKSALGLPLSSTHVSSPLGAVSQATSSNDDSSPLDSDADSEDEANAADPDHSETDSEDSGEATEPDSPGCADTANMLAGNRVHATESDEPNTGMGNPAGTAEPEDPGTNSGDGTDTAEADSSDTEPSNQADMAEPLDSGNCGDTGEPDDLCEGFKMTRERGDSMLEVCVGALFLEEQNAAGARGGWKVLQEDLRVKWKNLLSDGMQRGVVLDLEGVKKAITFLEGGEKAGIVGPEGWARLPPVRRGDKGSAGGGARGPGGHCAPRVHEQVSSVPTQLDLYSLSLSLSLSLCVCVCVCMCECECVCV
jgi:hypothetical protein